MPPSRDERAARRDAYVGVACTIVGAIGFSGKTVIVKLAYQHGVDVMTLLALRMLFALPLLLAMAWWAGPGGSRLTRHDWLKLVALGFLGYYLGSYLDLAGLQFISAGLGRLILYLYPTVVLLISAWWFRHAVGKRQWLSVALSYLGIVLVFATEPAPAGDPALALVGGALVFASAITYALYLVAGSRMVQTLGSMRFTAYASLAAAFFVITTFLVTHGYRELIVAPPVYGLTLVLAIFSTVLPLWLMAEGLKRIGANQVALVACIGPLSTIVLANIFLDEPVTPIQLVGAALVLAGVVIITLKPTPRAR